MPDSSAVDAALISKLSSDAALRALAPDGVYFDVAKATAKQFVIVSLVAAVDEPMFKARAFEDAIYLVKFVGFSSEAEPLAAATTIAAAARIDTLLEQGTLTITGYSLMCLQRVERVRYTEVDEVDRSIRWQHRGGRYQLVVSS